MPSANDSLLAELDPAIQGDLIMRKYRSMPWPVLRTTDFRPTSPSHGQSLRTTDFRPTSPSYGLSSTTVDTIKPKQLTFSDDTTFRPISPIRRSPRTSPIRQSGSPNRSDTSATRATSYRPLSPPRSKNIGRLSPSNNRTSPSRLSPEVSAISQRIFQSIDEIRKEIQITSDDAKNSGMGRYKHRAERDGSPSKYRDTSPTSRSFRDTSIRQRSPTRTFKSEASPSTRAFRQDLSLANTRNPRRQPRAEISRILGDVSEAGSPRKRVEFSETLTSSKRASSPVETSGNTSRPTITSSFTIKAKPEVSDPNKSIEDIIAGAALKSPTWHKMEKEGLQDAVEESEQRRMLLVNRLKDAQDTLKLQASTITSLKGEKERYKGELESLNFSKEESYNEKRNLTTRIKLMKSKCDELDEEVKELSRTSQGLKHKMEEKTKQCQEKNDRINELENELSAIRLSSADNGDQIAKLQETYDRARSQASILEQQNASLNDQNNDLIQERDSLSSKGKDLKVQLEEAETALAQLKSDLAISERERRELEEERRVVIGHKLDTQEALTKSNQVNMELQAQLDSLIEIRDFSEKENQQLRSKAKAIEATLSNKDLETSSRLVEIEALQRENKTLREINDSLKDRVDDAERGKMDSEHLIELLRTEKQELSAQKTDLFNFNEELNEEIKITKIDLGDRKQEYEMMYEEKEDNRKEKQQLQQLLDTLQHDSDTQKNYMETQCEELEKDIQRLEKERENVSEENTGLRKDIAALKEEANYNKNKADDWKNTAQSLEDSLNLSEQERQGVVEDLLRIQNELTDLKDEYGVVADERNRFLDKYNELRADCENLQEEVRELLLEKDENLHVIRLLETQKSILEEKWNGGRDLEAAQAECLELRADVKACRDRVKALEQSCDDMRNELTISTDKVSHLLGEKKVSQENLGRADKTIDLLNNDKDRLQKQVSAVSREFEKRVAALEDELESEQNKVLCKREENTNLKKRLDEALNIHGSEKSDLIKERNSLEDRLCAMERLKNSIDDDLAKKNDMIAELEAAKKAKEMKEAKLADALKAITGNPDVEDAFVEAATYMRTVKGAKETFEKEAKTIPGLESRIQELEENLDRSEKCASSRGADLELKSASIEELETTRTDLETNLAELETKKAEMERIIQHLKGEKEKLDHLVVEHDKLVGDHNKTVGDLTESQKLGAAIGEKRDSMDVENKKLRAENTKLSIELTDFKKALASKGDGERAMLEASNELRVVRDELENLMDIISTKDSKIEGLIAEIDTLTENVSQLNEESEAKSEDIRTLRSQVREGDRQKERVGDLDVDSSEVMREKEEQLKRQEKWLETYKAKIEAMERQKLEAEEEKARLREEKKGLERQMRDLHDTVDAMETEVDVMKEVLVETEAEREVIEVRNKDLMSQLDLLVEDQAKDDVVRRLHMVEDELKATKQRLQMSEDDKKQQYGNKDLKTPEEVAKIIEDIKEAFEDEIADLLLQEREQYETEKAQFETEKGEFRVEQEEFLKQAEEIAAEQITKKNAKVDEMQTQLDSALSELQKYRSGS
ncbi:myosin-9-like isoform X2 [Bolinopsis microptera]|uniref:myosin-9-like isoform X2 n=1 Tax=Bolinopsis microptera TaxID=2820187 RepID=UPI00307986CA